MSQPVRDVRRWQKGQSMVEFSIVCLFGVIVLGSIIPLLIEIDPSDGETSLIEAIRDNYRRYAFAMSVSELPDEYGSTLTNTGAINLGPAEQALDSLANGLPAIQGFNPQQGLNGVINDVQNNFNQIQNPLPLP